MKLNQNIYLNVVNFVIAISDPKKFMFVANINIFFVILTSSRDAVTQTKRESSTNVPKPSTFVAGLRGCNSTKTTMNVVDLTLDVDQT